MGRSRTRNTPPANGHSLELTRLAERLRIAENNAELLAERLADAQPLQESVNELELRLNDPGWQRFVALGEHEFSPEGLRQMRAICRLTALVNPLVKRGLNLRSAYVWGQGVEITARANGRASDTEQDVQAVVAAFLTDTGNQRTFTGPQARDQNEHALGHDGELFFALFTRPVTGEVQVRTILADEIAEIITNPEDRSEPWYYRRRWVSTVLDPATGGTTSASIERLYPCVDYRPTHRPKRLGSVDVAWDSPVLHLSVNRPLGWLRGVPDAYAAVNWARAYKEFLENWATVMKALARFSWRLTAKGNAKTQAQARLAQAPSKDPATGQAQDVGATAITPMDATLEAIPKSGATIDAESGRPLAMMVASALDVPVTMLLSDPGQTGARATAETLDQPTELAMQQRRELWEAAMRRILRYVIVESVRAPQGALKGSVKRDRYGRETLELAGDTTDVIDVDWPDLDDTDAATVVKAVVEASSTGTIPPEVVLRLLLTALGVRDVDTLVEAMLGDDGEFQWPQAPPVGGAGQQAADLERAGQDPAAAGPGRMTPGGGLSVPADPVARRQAGLDWGLSGGQRADAEVDEPEPPGASATGQPAAGPMTFAEEDEDLDDEPQDDEDIDLERFQLR